MLNNLRWKLVLIYLASSLGIVFLLMTGTYVLLNHYFIAQTDLALQYKMANEFHASGYELPTGLIQAEEDWLGTTPSGHAMVSTPTASVLVKTPGEWVQDEEQEQVTGLQPNVTLTENSGENDEQFDSRLSSIFVIPSKNSDGLSTQINNPTPIEENKEASSHALEKGYDLRTVKLADGTRVRLLTYRTGGTSGSPVLQLGILLKNQDSLLAEYLIGLAFLGTAASFLVALLSWFLAGRSIHPAQVAWNQQQAFIANASHELRAPLTVIRADAEYGLRSGHSSDQIEALKDVVGEVDYMDRMVEDLLLLSRLDANRLKLGIEAVDVVVLFDDVIGEIEKLAFTKKVKVIIGQARGTVLADRSRLRQVLLILLDNALRFSGKNGRVELDVVTTGQVVEISVIDQGPGISPEHIPHLFERFYQVPSDNSETMHGNGLGLSIAKGLVELQGGDIQVDSKVGEGTRFMVRLPSATP
jgi:signal transduction histidine kinase